MSTKLTIQQFIERGNSQADLAELLNVTRGAVNQMIKAGRYIQIIEHDDGSYSAYEVKPIYPREIEHFLPVI